MFKVAIGHSELSDSESAAKEILAQCKETLKDLKPQGGMLFASDCFNFQILLDTFKKAFPEASIIGCSSFGEISDRLGVGVESAALILFCSDQRCVYGALAENIPSNEYDRSLETVKEAMKGVREEPVLCCLFVDGLTSNISNVVKGLTTYFGSHDVLIAGGGACDDWNFKQVHQFHDNKVVSQAASMMIFTEPLKASATVRHGRSPLPLTERHIVTRSEGNTVYEIDHKPAFDFYKETLGAYATYEAYSLLIYLDDPEKFPDKYLVRAPFKIDKEAGTITFPGDVPENSLVGISQLSTQEKTLEAAKECARKAVETFSGEKIEAALIFSCALRKEILGTQTYKELEVIKNELPKDVPIFGYYTFGEVGPYSPGDPINYYNETIVIALIGQ